MNWQRLCITVMMVVLLASLPMGCAKSSDASFQDQGAIVWTGGIDEKVTSDGSYAYAERVLLRVGESVVQLTGGIGTQREYVYEAPYVLNGEELRFATPSGREMRFRPKDKNTLIGYRNTDPDRIVTLHREG